jgi:Glycosyltransferase family 87
LRLPQPGRGQLIRTGLAIVVFGVLPLFAVGLTVGDLASGAAAWGFRDAFLPAAETISGGDSPYPGLDDTSLVRGTAYVYPPLLAILVIPFTWVSSNAAVVIFAVLLVCAVAATLALLDVRDWRCYGLAFLWPPVLAAIHAENVSILMALAAALVWRYRDRAPLAGAALGASIAIKPLLWPLGLWLLVSRGVRAVAWSIAVALALVAGSWAVIEFADVGDYPDLLRRLSELMDEWGYTVYALALDLGVGSAPARLLGLVVAASLLLACVLLAHRKDDRRAYVVAVAAVIAASPIVWMHYFALLLVVVAVAEPRLGPAWFAPLLMYGGEEIANGETYQTALVLFAAALTVGLSLRTSPWPRIARRNRVAPRRLARESP